jgi:hypothetical protein
MKSPYNFIVRPLNGRRYDNVKKVGDVDFITSTSQEDHTVSNRRAEVVETPIGYLGPIRKGDVLLVHHNVFRYYYDMKGRQKSGRSFLKDDLFLIDDDQYFLYNSNGVWKSRERYCFVAPVDKEDFYLDYHGNEQPLTGILKYSNDFLSEHGLSVGDKVSFKPNSEYEFNIDGEKLYRVMTNSITFKF